jgi:hypothetical protein
MLRRQLEAEVRSTLQPLLPVSAGMQIGRRLVMRRLEMRKQVIRGECSVRQKICRIALQRRTAISACRNEAPLRRVQFLGRQAVVGWRSAA